MESIGATDGHGDRKRRSQGRLLRILGWLVLPALSLGALSAGQERPGGEARLEQLYAQAQEAQSHGDYRGAAYKYNQILKIQPNAAEIRANLGLMHHLLGEYPEAIQDFEAAVRQKPELYVPNLFLGLDLLHMQQPQRAVIYLKRARSRSPADPQPTLGLGEAYTELHEFSKANYWYIRASEINPASGDAWYGQGVTYLRLARVAAEQLGKKDQNSFYARMLRAESLEERGSMEDAVTAYQKILQSDSAPPCTRAALAFVYLFQNDESLVPLAAKQADEALGNDAGCLMARLASARIHLQGKDTASALQDLTEAWKADANFIKANVSRLWLGLKPETLEDVELRIRSIPPGPSDPAMISFLITAIDKWREEPSDAMASGMEPEKVRSEADTPAAAVAEKNSTPASLYSQGHFTACAQKLRPKLAGLPPSDLLLLAECAYNSGDLRTSFEAGAQLSKMNPDNPPGLYWQAKAAQKLAVGALVRASLAEPDSTRMHLLIAEAYRERQSFKEAEVEYSKVLGHDPHSIAANLGLGEAYWQDDQFDKAIPHLQEVLTRKPGDPDASHVLGAILVSQHRYAEAMPYLTAALAGSIAILPHVHALRSRVYLAQGQPEAALAEIKQSLDADLYGLYHYQLYQIYKKLGDEPAAAAALQQSETLRKRGNPAEAYPDKDQP